MPDQEREGVKKSSRKSSPKNPPGAVKASGEAAGHDGCAAGSCSGGTCPPVAGARADTTEKQVGKKTVLGKKYRWELPDEAIDEGARAVSLAFNLSFPVARALVRRGYTDRAAVEDFLFTPQDRYVGDAKLLKDADKAAQRLLDAITKHEKILIAGDYDVDGISSTALVMHCLLPLGATINFFLPHRSRDGYGLSVKTVQRAAQSGYTVVITVDNGVTAFEAAAEARRLGIDLIITDHHRPHAELPDAYALVNPCRVDCPYPHKTLAGVGVAFKLMQRLYEMLGRTLPDAVYEFLTLGTVADVVPLLGENRFWVRYGLRRMHREESLAVQALKRNVKLAKPLTSQDIGFFVAPQLNALGRLDDPRDGVLFLLSDDPDETARIGQNLHDLNQKRKEVERHVVDDVEMMIVQGRIDGTAPVLIGVSSAWMPGIIGLAAARLVGNYNRPVILLHDTGKGVLKGSCRSVPAFNIFEGLSACSDLLLHFGGHAMAAGLALRNEELPEFSKRLSAIFAALVKPEDLVPVLTCDAQISLADANKKLAQDLAYLEPFGAANERPIFYIKGVTLVDQPVLLKELHVRCMVFDEGVIKPIIFFGRPELYEFLVEADGKSLDFAVYVSENYWEGQVRIEFQGVDVALAE